MNSYAHTTAHTAQWRKPQDCIAKVLVDSDAIAACATVRCATAVLRCCIQSMIVWEGWLRKKTARGPMRVWQNRYFRLLGDILEYYKSDKLGVCSGTTKAHTDRQPACSCERL